MSLKNKKVIVFVETDYQDLEVWYPVLRLREEGIDVKIVGTGSSKIYKGKYGYPITVDIDADKINPANFDAVIIPGGWAPDYLRRYPSVVNIVKKMFEKEKIVASICHGASLLVSAGILKGKKITCFISVKDDVVNAGAKFLDEEVVVDGKLITSRKPDDLPAFCKAIIKALDE